ncbi:hypothetical protein HYC85_008141 [Camellia sinensis]|uniref:Plastocyanin-like domain-containing protein n=1 Tax=Camellia sinensis TaxID=4442 RepID=A0A7J7HRV5_CAMSI|nr:hypothetical protein HYC85_008141 [Camellia sinensis]
MPHRVYAMSRSRHACPCRVLVKICQKIPVSTQGTKVKMLNYNETVEIIFQGTNGLDSSETHPMHFHGYNFYVVGSGYGVWYWHCHFDRHLTWGMATVFVVKNGNTPETSMRDPPPNLPQLINFIRKEYNESRTPNQ